MMAEDYWSHSVPQSRYRKATDDMESRPVPMDLVSWESSSTTAKQALSARVDAVADLIRTELLGDAADSVNLDAALNTIKGSLGL